MQTSKAFLTNILMFCDSIHENKSSILSLFVRFKNTKNQLIFLFLNLHFNV